MHNIDTYREKFLSKQRRINIAIVVGSALLGTAFTFGSIHVLNKYVSSKPIEVKKPVFNKKCSECHNRQMAMSRYLEKKGAKYPDELAMAVLKTKSPKILAKIALTETRGDYKKRKYGYKKAHDGAFGVNRNDWGKVSHNVVDQALQAEDALNTFSKEANFNIVKGLNNYGGDRSAKKYANSILFELEHVP